MSGLRPLWALAAALVAGGAASPARADPPRPKSYALDWVRLEGGERCVGPRELASSVEELLGRQTLVSAAQADLNVEGRVGPRPGGWKATLQISNPRGVLLARRELTADGPDCRAIDEKVRLTLALITSPDAEARPLPAGWVAPVTPEPDPWKGLPATPEPDPWKGLPDWTEPDPWTGLPATPEPDPWYNLPAGSSARQPRGARPAPKRHEGAELTAFVGYGMGSGVIPLDGVTTRRGFGLGLGLRGDYLFDSGVWLGASYTYYAGGSFVAQTPSPSNGSFDPDSGVRGQFSAHAPAFEIGYALGAGALQVRPFFGFGAVFYEFRMTESFGRPGGRATAPDAVSRNGSVNNVAAWPGLALVVPVDRAFFSVEARWAVVGGSELTFPLSVLAGGGVRF